MRKIQQSMKQTMFIPMEFQGLQSPCHILLPCPMTDCQFHPVTLRWWQIKNRFVSYNYFPMLLLLLTYSVGMGWGYWALHFRQDNFTEYLFQLHINNLYVVNLEYTCKCFSFTFKDRVSESLSLFAYCVHICHKL